MNYIITFNKQFAFIRKPVHQNKRTNDFKEIAKEKSHEKYATYIVLNQSL